MFNIHINNDVGTNERLNKLLTMCEITIILFYDTIYCGVPSIVY